MKKLEEIKLIKRLTDKDIGEEVLKVDEEFKLRKASRGIVINKDGKIAILNKTKKNEYKLPGGGVENNETFEETFIREVLEEVGCKVKIISLMGYTEEIKTHEKFKQISYCYFSEVIEDTKLQNFTKKEKDEGSKILWLDINEAYEKIVESYDKIIGSKYDNLYMTKFIPKRDAAILEEYINQKSIYNKFLKNKQESSKDYLEKCLPSYLEKDLENLKEGIKNNVSYLDCLVDELQGSVNSAFVEGNIAEEQCDYIYKKYIRMEEEDD